MKEYNVYYSLNKASHISISEKPFSNFEQAKSWACACVRGCHHHISGNWSAVYIWTNRGAIVYCSYYRDFGRWERHRAVEGRNIDSLLR